MTVPLSILYLYSFLNLSYHGKHIEVKQASNQIAYYQSDKINFSVYNKSVEYIAAKWR
jgi:hypothetical protein